MTPKAVGRNPLYPLPPDYGSLSLEGQRQARVNAVCYQKTPRDLVWAWNFFRSYYLRQTRPGFFYKRYVPSPPFHYQMVHDIGNYPWNAIAAPRGHSKSTVLAVEVPMLLLLSRPHFSILLVLSKDTMVAKRMSLQISYQFQNNKYIVDDFGPLKSPKGKGIWSSHLMQLPNGAVIESCPARGGMLGSRPDLILVDDAEVDPVLNKVTSELRENYERFLMDHLMPMIEEGGSSLYWIGTLLSKQCFLYHVVTTTTDKRFRFWNRRLLDSEDDGSGQLLWPEKFSRERLDREKEMWGIPHYNAQRRNRPGVGSEAVMSVHVPLGHYDVEEADDYLLTEPLQSSSALIAWRQDGVDSNGQPIARREERPFGKTVASMFRVLTMDYAKCLTPSSDYVAMAVIGVDSSPEFPNVWWVLDLLVERLPGHSWVPKFWEIAYKWRVQYAGIEAVAAQESLVNTAQDFQELAASSGGWSPVVVPIRYPSGLSKEDRMGGLEWRFRRHKIKYPTWRHRWPWTELYHETECFTGMPGASQYDDALDAVAMAQFLLKGQGNRSVESEDPRAAYDPLQALSRGNLVTPEGIQIGLGVRPSDLPAEVLDKLYRRAYELNEERSVERRGPWIGVR